MFQIGSRREVETEGKNVMCRAMWRVKYKCMILLSLIWCSLWCLQWRKWWIENIQNWPSCRTPFYSHNGNRRSRKTLILIYLLLLSTSWVKRQTLRRDTCLNHIGWHVLWFMSDGPSSLVQTWTWLNLAFVIGLLSGTGIGGVCATPSQGWSQHTV